MHTQSTNKLRVASLEHVWCETPGRFGQVLARDGIAVRSIRLYENEPLPASDDFDGLLVMGGPMNVDETDTYAWLADERRLIADAVRADKPVLGICLGAQLIARAAGAAVYPKRPKEIGLFNVELTDAGRSDPLLGPLGSPLEVLQWHGDTFDLPTQAVLLASSTRYPHQAFRIGTNVYALQFHLECTMEIIANLRAVCADELAELPADERFERFDDRLPAAIQRQNEAADRMIHAWARLLGSS